MKLYLVLLACLGATLAAPKPHIDIKPQPLKGRSLLSDILDIVAILPLDDLSVILDKHVESDPALSYVIGYLQGKDWNNLVDEVLAKPTTKEFIDYLNKAGIPVDLVLIAIRAIIDGAKPGAAPDETASLRSFLDEIEGALPVDDLVALINDKLQNSPDFQDLYTTIASEDGKALVDEVLQMDEAQFIQKQLKAMEVDVDAALKALYDFFGWGAPPKMLKISSRALLDDILDFVALLPLDKLLEILDDHVANDPALSYVISYLQGDDWNKLVDEVLAKPTAQEFIDYLNKAGIPVDLVLTAIRAIIDGAKPGAAPDETASLRSFLDEIEGALPVDDLVALINDKLQNSPDFQDLYTTIASEDGKALVDEVLQMDEAQFIQKQLKAMEVDVDAALKALYDFFGWGAPPKNLKIGSRALLDDILDIAAVIPIDEIKIIVEKYVYSDSALAYVIKYLQGKDWNSFVDEVLDKPTSKEFIDYLNNAGIPVDLVLAAIRAIIDGADPKSTPDETASLRSFLDQIELVIPMDDLAAVINDKLENSPDFQDLYTTIASEDGKALVDEVLQMDEAQLIQKQLKVMEVEVDAALKALYDFFGWGAPPKKVTIGGRLLLDDILDFVALLPLDKLVEILDDHIDNDPAMAYTIKYLQGDKWNTLVDEVLAKPAAKDFMDYLRQGGIPIDIVIITIRGLIDGATPGSEPDEAASLRPFLDEFEAALPIDDLVALLNDKLQNSPDFQDLYTTIASEDGKALVDEVLRMDSAKDIITHLKAVGVDVDAVLKALYDFFGWGAPPKMLKIGSRALLDDILDFVALLPLDKLLEILDDHVANDPALSYAISYLQGEDWNKLVDEVLAKPAAKEFIEYLDNAGVPAELIIIAIRGIIGGATPGTEPDEAASLRPFLDELEAQLPFEDLAALLNDKLQNSVDFQDLYTTIASEDGKALVDEVLQMDEAKHIQEYLKSAGVDVDGVLAALYEFFGWGKPPKF